MLKNLIYDESGIETIEWIAMVVIAAALLGFIRAVGGIMKGKASGASTQIISELNNVK